MGRRRFDVRGKESKVDYQESGMEGEAAGKDGEGGAGGYLN